ncbi:MAG: TRAP transporter permease [Eggerthellaceae bacterium]|nr:TRAP transporter permease [Eggerthellaceae bacterium]
MVLGLFKKKYGFEDKGEYSLVAEPVDGVDVAASFDVADAATSADSAQEAIEAADAAAVRSADSDGAHLSELLEDSSSATGEAAQVAEGASEAEVDEIMRKYDRESNTRIWEGKPKIVVSVLMALFSIYCICMTLFYTGLPETRLSMFVGFVILIGYIMYPARKGHVRVNHIPWYDIVLMVVGAGCFFYFAFNAMSIIRLATRIEPIHVTLAVVGVLVVMELCRRCVGIPILVVVGCLLIYAFYWQFNNGTDLYMTLRNITYKLFYTTNGIIGTPINVCYTYIVLFIIFGAFLERTGIAAFFISLANRIAGWSSGGAAKVAVISSALCGMVSGSSVGNTVTTGSVTIPMMKKTGYKPEFAGAVEAASSTGGQIMPPIMGAAAFLMAEYMGIPYIEVAAKAIIPALLYFAGIFITVHLEAKKLGLKGIPMSELPKASYLIKNCYLVIPLVLLVWLVASGARTMAYSAAISILGAFIIGYINFFFTELKQREEGETIGQVFASVTKLALVTAYEALQAGAKSCVTVAVACAMAGMIAGCITVTGLASTLVNTIVNFAGDATIIGLVLTMLACIVLGMGVPTTANYCIMASTTAPILIAMHIDPIAAHFFVFYFGIVADITPPVALAAYAGSAIAKSNPMKTGLNAAKLAIAAFIVPYILAFNPVMILVGDFGALQLAQVILTSLIGLFGIAAALNGNLFCKINPVFRILFAVGGILMMVPGTMTDLIGIALVAVITILQFLLRKRSNTPAAPAAA